MSPGRGGRRRVVVTAGPTRERIDPVRYLSNDSSGTMGFAIAEAAAARGDHRRSVQRTGRPMASSSGRGG